jgi:hypothetical protein
MKLYHKVLREQSILTYTYPTPPPVDKPTIQKSLEDEKEWEHSDEDEVTQEQFVGGFGPEHVQHDHKCPEGYKW